MEKDFDIARAASRGDSDRQFKIGGELFTRRKTVRPEAVKPWEDVGPLTPHEEVLKAIDQTILNLIEPGTKGEDHKRWRELRKREEPDALNLGDLLELTTWIVSQQSSRPTSPPVLSSASPEPGGTSSTDDSSSPVTEEESTD